MMAIKSHANDSHTKQKRSRKKMEQTINEDESSSTVSSFEDCTMSSTSEEMYDLALKFLANLRSDTTEEMMHNNALEALCQITSDVVSEENLEKKKEYFGETLWLEDINTAMECFSESESVQETACRCLSALLQGRPSLCQFIGGNAGQFPLSCNISVALAKHWNSPALFKSACDAVLVMLHVSHKALLQQVCSVIESFHWVVLSVLIDILQEIFTERDSPITISILTNSFQLHHFMFENDKTGTMKKVFGSKECNLGFKFLQYLAVFAKLANNR